VAKSVFDRFFSASLRIVTVRAATIVNRYRLPADSRSDLVQECLLELWRKRQAYDSQRGSWPTFCERVATNKLASLVRRIRSERSGEFKRDAVENLFHSAAPNDRPDLRVAISQVLGRVSHFDRSVALCMMDVSAIETSRDLGVCRASIYRSLGRLRAAFMESGFPGSQRHRYGARHHCSDALLEDRGTSA